MLCNSKDVLVTIKTKPTDKVPLSSDGRRLSRAAAGAPSAAGRFAPGKLLRPTYHQGRQP
jgi:hypothetical protein